MSRPGVSTGIEWNIRTTAADVVVKFEDIFESYWSGEHTAFRGESMLEYNSTDCDWERLCGLFTSEVEPRCNDIDSNCHHAECLQLRQQRDRILEKFRSANEGEGHQKRSRPPEHHWDLHQRSQPKKRNTRKNTAEKSADSSSLKRKTAASISSEPHRQIMNTDKDNEVGSELDPPTGVIAPEVGFTRGFYQKLLCNAILDNNRTEIESILKVSYYKFLPHTIWGDRIPDPVLEMARTKRGKTPLDIYHLGPPLLFALAYSVSQALSNCLSKEV